MNKKFIASVLTVLSVTTFAKMPPLSDEAKAKAEEAKALAAYNAKVDAYMLCKSQDKVATFLQKNNKAKAGKPEPTPPCVDPGKFVNTSPEKATSVPTSAAPAKKS